MLPGQRAGRLLLAELVGQCQVRGLNLLPPRVLTPGALLATATADQPVATETESILGWMKALRAMAGGDAEAIAPLLPHLPSADDVPAWHELAGTIARLHADLTGGDVSFLDVADRAEGMEMIAEGARWRVLDAVMRKYRGGLKKCGLGDPHEARAEAAHRGLPNPPQLLVLIGVTELNAPQRDLIAALDERAVALVHAPASLADRFDELGCVVSDAWSDTEIGLADSQIHVADKPNDQAQQLWRDIAGLNGRYSASQITIGLGDESVAAAIENSATWASVEVRAATGRPLSRSAPVRLLRAAAEWLSEPRFANFASLLRHPDVERWILNGRNENRLIDNWLTLLDRYFSEFLHERLAGDWLCDGEMRDDLAAVYRLVHELLSPLSSKPSERRLGEWGAAILKVLAAVYESHPTTSSADSLAVCVEWRDALAEMASIPESLQPRIDAAGAIELLFLHLEGTTIAEEPRDDQIEMLGWLELHLDTAPALIITGFNEGCVPRTVQADAFLPDALRSALGLPNNHHRYARDAYLIEAIRHSRESLSIIVGRRSLRDEPLAPSRLLLACDQETLVRRVRAMCDDSIERTELPAIGLNDGANGPKMRSSRFVVPPLPPLSPPARMRITDFRKYLECPYRYALGCLLELEGFGDGAVEMDPLLFGSLAHEVLCDFGTDESINRSNNADDIQKYLQSALHKRARRRFGSSPIPAVQVQLARLEQRLRSFATFQAQHRDEGWLIGHCEHKFEKPIALDIPGQEPMPLHGKIDRIDVNQKGEWLIIDYKTSEAGDSPHHTHHGCEKIDGELEWSDLQLPLYHYLATRSPLGLAPNSSITLGYICLPKQTDGVDLRAANWTAQHLDAAVDVARDVVRKIRAGEFPPNRDLQSSFDDYARICQAMVFRADDGEGDE